MAEQNLKHLGQSAFEAKTTLAISWAARGIGRMASLGLHYIFLFSVAMWILSLMVVQAWQLRQPPMPGREPSHRYSLGLTKLLTLSSYMLKLIPSCYISYFVIFHGDLHKSVELVKCFNFFAKNDNRKLHKTQVLSERTCRPFCSNFIVKFWDFGRANLWIN